MAPPPVPDRTETLDRPAPTQDASDVAPFRVVTLTSDPAIDDPERYQEIAEHGRGGLGRVVRAVDKRLGRTVAVKELLRRGDSNEARFLREALITARLEHPGIVPVHEAGRWANGDPYYVMKLVEGRTLKEQIGSLPTLRERLGLLPHVIAVADAVGYAHSQGVIHRDLKPSNVIVGEFGETVVVDWGLARDRRRDIPEPTEEIITAAGSGVSTVSGRVVGTPAYMSPEQARGELVDERADVYAIGALLYELLAGSPPHHDDTPQATLDRVLAGPPSPLQIMVPHVPSELATIVAKAMARCPVDRYPDAAALAEDLRRFTTGKLVSAHSYTAWSLLRKKLSHHRGVVAMAAASAVALGAVGVESVRRVVAQRNIARLERANAEDARRQSEQRQHELVLLQAVTSLRKDPTASLAWLKAYPPGDRDRAQVVDVVDEALALGVARHVFRTGDWVADAMFTPDGTQVIAIVRDGLVRRYDLRTGVETILGKSESTPTMLVVSRDGRVAVTGGQLGEVTVWPLSAAGGQPRVVARGNRVGRLELSEDGARVLVLRESSPPEIVPLDGSAITQLGPTGMHKSAIASGDWTRRVITTGPSSFAAVVGDELRPLGRTPKALTAMRLSPRGDLLVVHDGTTIWSVPFAGGPLKPLAPYDAQLQDLAWSPDQRTLAIAGWRHEIVLVDLVSGKVRELSGHQDTVYTVQWSRDGRRLLSASDDGTARVWTVADGTSDVLRGHDDDVIHARFSSDERQVVSSSLDGSVRVWWVEQPGAKRYVEGSEIDGLMLAGDLALVTTQREVARWNIASGHREPLFSWAQDARGLGEGMPSPDGERLVVPTADWSLEVRARAGGPPLVLHGHRAQISHIEWSRDSSQLYTSSFDGTVRRWDVATGTGTTLIDGDKPVRSIAVAADNRVAVEIGDSTQLIRPDGRVAEVGQGKPWCGAYGEFEPVRDRLVLRRCDHGAFMLDGARRVELPTDNADLGRLAVSRDGTRIAGAMGDRTVRVWEAATGRVLRVLRGHSDLVLDVAFSPDGTTLASASYDRTIRIWDLATDRHRVLRGHGAAVNRIAWHDPDHVVTASTDGTLRVWDVPPLELPSVAEIAGRLDAATSARIDRDRPTTDSRTAKI